MTRIWDKSITKIILIILIFVISEMNYGAEVLSITTGNRKIDGGNSVKWIARNIYVKEIVVLRLHKNEEFSIIVPDDRLIKAWRYSGHGHSKEEQEFEQRIYTHNRGITQAYGGPLTVKQTNGYEVENYESNRNKLNFKLKYEYSTNAKPTIRGSKIINVSKYVPDGRYNIYTSLAMLGTGKVDVAAGTLVIKSLPTIEVEGIDFGDQPLGEYVNLEETSNISIRGGTVGESYTLSIESATGSGTVNNFIMYLKNPNSPNENIPVRLSIDNIEQSPRLGLQGDANLILKAKINTKAPSKGGEYTGKAKIIFQYD